MEEKQLSKAERYNNPGALRPNRIVFDGQVDVDNEGFAIFATPEAGRRALINQINLEKKRGRNTVDLFLEKYAPPSKENPPAARDAYRVFLAEQLGLKSTDEPFPENSTEKLANAITQFESGRFQPSTDQTSDSTTKPPTIEQRLTQLAKELPGAVKGIASEVAEENPATTRAVLDVAGAVAGANLGQMGQAGAEAFEEKTRRDLARQRLARMTQPQAASPPAAQPAETPGAKWGRKVVGEQFVKPGASSVTEVAADYRRATPQGKIAQRLPKSFNMPGAGEPGMSIVDRLIARQQEAEQMARSAQAQQPRPQSYFDRMTRGAIQGTQAGARTANLMAQAFPRATGALSGLGATELFQEAYRRGQEGDDLGKYIAAAGGVGATASVYPALPTRVGGGALAMTSPLVLYMYDKLRAKSQPTDQYQLAPLQYFSE